MIVASRPAPRHTDNRPAISFQDAVLAELRAIRQLLERQQRPSSLTRADRTALARLLPAVGGVFGSDLFMVRELFESTAAAVRLVLEGCNPKQVGRLLRRAEGVPIAGLMVQRDGSELHAALWRIVRASA